MLKFKVGDTVEITLGKDKGRQGKIEKVFPKRSTALIPGINVYKKHVKGAQGKKGGIYDIPRPLPFSKFTLVCPECKKSAKVGFKQIRDEKVRVCKRCNKEISSKKS